MRWLLSIVAVGCAGVATVAACVGDDPGSSDATSSGATSSGGSSGGSSGASSGGSSGGSSSGGSSSGSSGTDGAADANDGAIDFNVRSLTGLKLWLESTKELQSSSSGGFSQWWDQSGAWDAGGDGSPDAGRHVAEPHNVNPPTIVPNGINGRPSVYFVSGNGYLHIASHPDFQFGLGDFIIAEVAKVSSGTGPLWQLRLAATAGYEEQFLTSHFCNVFGTVGGDHCTAPDYVASTDPHVYVARRKGDIFTLRVDSVVKGTEDTSADPPNIFVSPYSQPYVFIGNSTTMQVSELIVVVGPTSDTTLATLEAFLKQKYGIP